MTRLFISFAFAIAVEAPVFAQDTVAPVTVVETPVTREPAVKIPGEAYPFVMVAAHRGGYSNDKQDRAPENSLANLRLAIKKGYDVYETDIRRTADGVFVIVHDATLQRETNGTAAPSELTLAEIKKLKKRYRDKSMSDQQVVTLEELLRAGKGKILFKPDLKPGMIDHFTEIATLISDLKMSDQVFLRTQFKNVQAIKKCFDDGCPKVEVMFRTKNIKQVKTVIDVFHPRTIQVDLVSGDELSEVNTAAIRFAAEAGVLVETHTPENAVARNKLARLGVRMLHTRKPDAALKSLTLHNWRVTQPVNHNK